MEKRIFLAVVISIALLGLWSWALPKFFPELAKKPAPAKVEEPVQKTAATSTATTTSVPATGTAPGATQPATISAAPAVPQAAVVAARVQTTTVDTDELRAVFSNRGAQLVSFELKGYKRKDDDKRNVDLVRARPANRTDFPFAFDTVDQQLDARLNSGLYAVTDRTERGVRVLEYRFSDGRHTATKTFRLDPARPYLFDYSTSIQPPVAYRVEIGPGIGNPGKDEIDSAAIITGHGVVQTEGKFKVLPREKGDAFQIWEPIDYVGIEDNYFLAVLRPATGKTGVLEREVFTDPATKKKRPDFYAGVNATASSDAGSAFFGPKETKVLDAYDFGEALQFGWFGTIARFFLTALSWINQYTHNWGFAIIVLTILSGIL